jgi:catechol 2,3-dioxygenase-like lactoylglutathione lyase family enzyme
MDTFRVLQIDHVELFVPDRQEAADWYCRVLGLHVVPGFEQWTANPGGPLMIATTAGGTKLALFEGQPQQAKSTAGFHRVAFRVGADAFMAFVRRLEDHLLKDHQGRPVTADAVVDHDLAYSIYFCDPYGHRLEVTTYEHDAVRDGVR